MKLNLGVKTVMKNSGNHMDPARLFKKYAEFQTVPTSPNMVILRPGPSYFRPYTVQDQMFTQEHLER